MMVTRTEAAQAVNSACVDIKEAELSIGKVHKVLVEARELESSQRQLVVTELATRVWMRQLAETGPLYPEAENVVWANLLKRSNLEQEIRMFMASGQVGPDVTAIYADYLRSMFEASGKTRPQFYEGMLFEAGITMSLDDAEFGEEAVEFYGKAIGSVHREHLLVFYSVGLLLKLYRASDANNGVPITDSKLEVAYKYFERGIPLGDKFLDYAEDDTFLTYSLEQGRLSEIK